MREPQPAVAVTLSFIDAINRTDFARLLSLMTPDHALHIFDEPPLVGRSANADAWRGHFAAFPAYVIYPRQIAETPDAVAVLGHTTGSHLALPDAEEASLTLIWLAEVVDGKVRRWSLVEDTPGERARYQFAAT